MRSTHNSIRSSDDRFLTSIDRTFQNVRFHDGCEVFHKLQRQNGQLHHLRLQRSPKIHCNGKSVDSYWKFGKIFQSQVLENRQSNCAPHYQLSLFRGILVKLLLELWNRFVVLSLQNFCPNGNVAFLCQIDPFHHTRKWKARAITSLNFVLFRLSDVVICMHDYWFVAQISCFVIFCSGMSYSLIYSMKRKFSNCDTLCCFQSHFKVSTTNWFVCMQQYQTLVKEHQPKNCLKLFP